MKANRPSKKSQVQAALLGLGLDNDDGHTRLTRGDNFVLFGGSQDTHSLMQETAIKVNEQLAKLGMRLEDASPGQLHAMIARAVNARE